MLDIAPSGGCRLRSVPLNAPLRDKYNEKKRLSFDYLVIFLNKKNAVPS